MEALTAKQQEILTLIRKAIETTGLPPTRAEIAEAMDYVRHERKPFCLQANVSRLYGHSSSSGANRYDEPDCIGLYEQRLIRENLMTQAEIQAVWDKHNAQLSADLQKVAAEPMPGKEHVLQHVWHEGPAGN